MPDIDMDTPRDQTRAPRVAAEIMTRELLALDDEALHAKLIELRDHHQTRVDGYNRWIAAVRRRQASQTSERQAAEALGVSKTTIAKATSRKKR